MTLGTGRGATKMGDREQLPQHAAPAEQDEPRSEPAAYTTLRGRKVHPGEPGRRLWAVFVVGVAVLGLLAWGVNSRIGDLRAEQLLGREWERALSLANAVDARIGMQLVRLRSVPNVLSQESQIVAALVREGADVQPNSAQLAAYRELLAADERLRALEQRLEVMVREFNVDQLWVLNAAGDCIASGGFPLEGRATGVNFADRDYFRMAMRGHVGRQSAVGRTTGVLSIYYAAPVLAKGQMLGVVVAKIEARQLNSLLPERGVFVTDELGVVVASGDAEVLLKSLPGAKALALSRGELRMRYQRETLDSVPLRPAATSLASLPGAEGVAGLAHVGERKSLFVLANSASQADFMQIWVLREVSELGRLREEGWQTFLLALLAGTSLWSAIVLAYAYRRRNAHWRREMRRVNGELFKLSEQLRVQGRYDALTRSASRVYFLDELGGALRRALRSGQPCALAVLDVDGFKAVNDSHGTAVGDAALVELTRRCMALLRSTDLFGRLEGEEFAVLMPDTGRAGALELAERLRACIAAEDCICGEVAVALTVSVGVSAWRGSGDSVEALLARAEAAMYEAKQNGHNRVAEGG